MGITKVALTSWKGGETMKKALGYLLVAFFALSSFGFAAVVKTHKMSASTKVMSPANRWYYNEVRELSAAVKTHKLSWKQAHQELLAAIGKAEKQGKLTKLQAGALTHRAAAAGDPHEGLWMKKGYTKAAPKVMPMSRKLHTVSPANRWYYNQTHQLWQEVKNHKLTSMQAHKELFARIQQAERKGTLTKAQAEVLTKRAKSTK
jgi:hypothetical protein